MITNISSSVITSRMNNRNNGLYRNGSYISGCHQCSRSIDGPHWKFCKCCKCSNRVLTCIVITILPIAITSTLICIFMMQKTNLHEFAIYSFVVFCIAFVFPFVLFFVTVILNKIYNCYKRGNQQSYNCQLHHQHLNQNNENNELMSLTNNHNRLCQSPSPIRSDRIRNVDAELYTQSRVLPLPPYYFSLECSEFDRHLTVSLPPISQMTAEDSPPSYEMAMLCPRIPVNGVILNNSTITDTQPPPPYFEKIT